MELIMQATNAIPHGKTYVTNKGTLRVGQAEGDYAVLKGVDFGKGKQGIRVTHIGAQGGVCLIEIRIDSEKGKVIGVPACASQDSFRNAYTVWAEITKTTGIHDVYLFFHGTAEYTRFEFTNDSPYKTKDYTPVPDKCIRNVMADTWEATDMLGRKIPSPEDCGDKRDKKVGIFYWTWHEAQCGCEPQDLTKILREFPEAEWDFNHRIWKPGPNHWGEPLFGYYRDTDPYIIRKHAVMLSAAGVDFLAFDTTNGSGTKKEAYRSLFEGLRLAKMDGIKVPQVTFIMNFWKSPTTEYMLRSLYQDIYKPGLFSELWFRVNGKPMLMADPGALPEKGFSDEDTAFLNEIREFFTFRPGQPGYKCGPRPEYNNTEWGWLESAPQHKYVVREDGSCEQMTVGVAQNQNAERTCTHFNAKDTFGRSYTYKHGHALLTEDSYKYGYNFQEQWDYALEGDPDHIFVTGWNEWIMGRFTNPWVKEEGSTQVAFVDQYDREHSRDIEPDRDGYLDTYYLQLVANIRRFKGTAKLPKASAPKTIDLKAGEEQWAKVAPVYMNPKGSTPPRSYPGFGATLKYQNLTGRNDIIEARVARDEENLYFYAKCSDKIVGTDTDNCMVLYLDLDRSKETGWEGYELRICGKELQKSEKAFEWTKVGTVKKQIKGDFVQIAVPKKLLGLGDSFDIEFKWSDNAFTNPDFKDNVMDFYVNGVTAPIGRFNFRYKV